MFSNKMIFSEAASSGNKTFVDNNLVYELSGCSTEMPDNTVGFGANDYRT